jgi:acyl-CoA thioesterase
MDAGHDIDWLGLTREGAGRWAFELTPPLTRFDGKFYGGTGIAIATALLEAETGRDALWATVQFASTADVGARIDCDVEVLASGNRTSQVRLTARVGDRIVFAGLGASGAPRSTQLTAQFATMPDVDPPEATAPWRPNVPFAVDMDRPSWITIAELREPRHPESRHSLWARMRERPQTRATIGFLADMVPSAVVRAAGRAGAGTSLDNAMRFGTAPDTEWILIDFDPYFASGGYAHGGARLWSTDGILLGVASQTAAVLLFD